MTIDEKLLELHETVNQMSVNLLGKSGKLLTEAHWLIEHARCQGEYGLAQDKEFNDRYAAWKKEVGV